MASASPPVSPLASPPAGAPITSPASPIPFRRAMEFAYGRCDRLSPLVRRVIAENPSPFTFHGTGTYIVGEGEVAVIDPGPLLAPHVEAILAALDAGEKVSHILITHSHADHCPAAKPLQERTGAPIYGMRLAEAPRAGALPETDNAQLEEGLDDAFVPDVALAHEQIVRGESWTVECLHTPGHINNHFCFALQEEATLFCGDHIMGWATPIIAPPDGDLADYLASLDLLLVRQEKIYWPTHGPHIDEPQAFVAAVKAHRLWRNQGILDCLQKKGACSRKELVQEIYADITPQLHPAAARSLQAHLNYLLDAKAIRRISGATAADARYGLAALASASK